MGSDLSNPLTSTCIQVKFEFGLLFKMPARFLRDRQPLYMIQVPAQFTLKSENGKENIQ